MEREAPRERRIPRGFAFAFLLALGMLLALSGAAPAALEVSTYAGTAQVAGSANGARSTALFYRPGGIAIDVYGNQYVADQWNHVIRKISPAGIVSTLAGTVGVTGSADGVGGAALFNSPADVAIDPSGRLFVADTGNSTIRVIAKSGMVTTLAGSAGSTGHVDAHGAAARFFHPSGIAVSETGGVPTVYVADRLNHVIRKINESGDVTTIVGAPGYYGSLDGVGKNAHFKMPSDLVVDASGPGPVIYVTDTGNHTVRRVWFNVVTWVWSTATIAGKTGTAGSDDGSPGRFNAPWGIALDGSDALYVGDYENNTIRKITRIKLGGGTVHLVSTVAGAAPLAGSTDGPAAAARFVHPWTVAVHPAGTVYVGDYENHTIRRIAEPPTFTQFVGPDRYETAILISKKAYPGTVTNVFLVKGDDFPDALAAAPLAAAYDGPVILTPSGGLTPAVKAELTRLNPGKVFFIGLSDSLKPAILQAVPGVKIETIRGIDRYDTATRLADALVAKAGTPARIVLVAGDKFPDALSVAPLAGNKGWPILLTPQAGSLPNVTRDKIVSLGVTKALRVGTYVDLPTGVAVVSKVGTDRYHTSALVAAYGDSQTLSYAHLAVATGENYPDALVVGPYLAKDGGILLLTHPTSLPTPIRTELTVNRDWVKHVDFPGLPAGMIATVKGVLK
ncbi:MAG: cell wall-binding repeat-containing protein [Actinobacteria bacterium]|nr:cell wall-binding repeat-containing protein [Actinomycetota bacterium]